MSSKLATSKELARAAEAALSEYLEECGNSLWPDERRNLRRTRLFLAKKAEGSSP